MKITNMIAVLFATVTVLLTACAHQANISAPGDLTKYQHAYVKVDTTATEAVNDLGTLQELIIGELNNRSLYSASRIEDKNRSANSLVIHVSIIKLHRFNSRRGRMVKQDFDHFNVRQQIDYFSNLRGITIGQAFDKSQVIALVSLRDGSTGKRITDFHLAGNSARMSLSGIDWRWGDLQDALQDVANQLANRITTWNAQSEKGHHKS